MKLLYPIFERLIKNRVKIYIFTRASREHSESMEIQSELEIQRFEEIGVQIFLCTGNHHRKLAIIDRSILWEGSLNILSYTRSKEIMRRIKGEQLAKEMIKFLGH